MLAVVICQYESELICDFAETYHIFEYRALRPSMAAVLLLGLREDSRVKMVYSESRMNVKTMLLASIADRLAILIWHNTEDGRNGKNPPKLILNTEQKEEFETFENPEDFHRNWDRITKG